MPTVCLDPGHGGRDGGAARQGLKEKDLTLAIAQAARDALRPRYRVLLTRAADLSLSLAGRREIADRARAALFVSIHVNASTSARAAGVEVFVGRPADARSFVLAVSILRAMVAHLPQRPNRGIKQRSLGVLRQARPAVLVECYFLSNPAERALLARPSIRDALGRAIALGCERFFTPPLLSARPSGGRVATGRGRTARPAARSPRRPAARPG